MDASLLCKQYSDPGVGSLPNTYKKHIVKAYCNIHIQEIVLEEIQWLSS
jgi:hypothetical protein